MPTTTTDERRELAHRTGDGIDICLLWSKSSDRVTLVIVDARSEEELEFEVDGGSALDAFYHPYAYLAGDPSRTASAVPLEDRR